MQVARDICDRIKAIDAQIVELSADGYGVEVDRLLDERREWENGLGLLMRVVLARS